ncbi:MAG: hypothetical protein ACO38V_03520 [Phycisphaerales bacterium]
MSVHRGMAVLLTLAAATPSIAGFTWSENFDALPLGPYSSPFWTPLSGTLPAGVAVTDATSVSAPNSLMFDPSLIGPGTPNYGSVEAGIVFNPNLSFTATQWCINLDIRRDATAIDSYFEVVAYDANGNRQAVIAIGDEGYGNGPSLINATLGSPFAQANSPYTLGEWIHVEWEIQFYGDGTGGQAAAVNGFQFSNLPIGSFDAPITSFGLVFRDMTGAFSGTTYIDNLSFTAVPAPGAIALLAMAGLSSRRRRG